MIFLISGCALVEEIKQLLGLPVLGVVPHMVARTPVQRGMQLHLDPMSDVAEAYRTIRTAVYFGVPAGITKTLLVTSPSPGDGKTTLVSNLAVAMAQAGNRVLLLDADFRKPAQHKIFELEKSTGLSSLLAGEVNLDSAIKRTEVNGLEVLPCGPIPANPSEILNSQMFADLLEQLSERYDHVLLDSPPVVPVTDARILAASCGATLLALRAEKTTRKTASYARDVLRGVGRACSALSSTTSRGDEGCTGTTTTKSISTATAGAAAAEVAAGGIRITAAANRSPRRGGRSNCVTPRVPGNDCSPSISRPLALPIVPKRRAPQTRTSISCRFQTRRIRVPNRRRRRAG